ncbi:hypothetical protein HYX02_02380 [Candidatus Woesearchaeota archaeon]|nr:hypothetical protein [Candidatus Woesearchaeota archaeon]
MKFTRSCYFPMLVIIGILLISSCAQREQPVETQPSQEEPLAEVEQPQPSPEEAVPVSTPPEESNKTPETPNVPVPPPAAPTPPPVAAAEPKLPEPKLVSSAYPDSFEGTYINTEKYSTKVVGQGSIAQDNAIIITGNAANEVVWNILYTNQNIDLAKDFTITADIDLTADVKRGNAAAIISLETLDGISKGKMPERNYCELSINSNYGAILRTRKSAKPGIGVPTTAGKMLVSFNPLKEEFICSFGGVELVDREFPQYGKFVLALRSGIYDIGGAEKEIGGSGSFTAKFDNLDLIVKKD